MNAVLAFITAIYILLYRRQLKRMAMMLLDLLMPKKQQELFLRYMVKIHEYFAKFVLCQLLDGAILGAAMTVIFYAAGVEYASLLGPLVGVGNLIPCFGAIISGGIAILVILMTDGVSTAILTGARSGSAEAAQRIAQTQSPACHHRNHGRRRLLWPVGYASGHTGSRAAKNDRTGPDPV